MQDVSSRVVKFIIPQSVERVQEQETSISDLISLITGGQAVIQVGQAVIQVFVRPLYR